MGRVDEIVALYDEQGRPVGSAPRSRMRAENLRHAATGVVVRDSWGRVFVHRRTDTKDVYPGRYDFSAGGVLLAGEDPDEAAARELEEELGVTAPLRSLGEADYADEHTNYHAFLYETTWDGPLRLQPEEVASGEWLTLESLAAMLADPDVPVMPDAAAVLAPWLRERLADQAEPEQGWDSQATIVEGRWLDRTPRRPEVADRLRAETRLLPEIAPLLPLAVPVPVLLDDEPVRVRHVLVPGQPAEPARLTAADGECVGRFLKSLHAVDPDAATAAGARDAAALRRELERDLADFAERVVPLLPADRRPDAQTLLAAVVSDGPTCLIHGDLGPEHLFTTAGRICGVIDWTDAGIGDPATDLAWALNGTTEQFAGALAAAYGVDAELVARARLRHRLGPWWEVTAGLDFLGPAAVESGLAGVLARL
jgi:aminoglycoside phosphotransferase (APT) family kinase protein/8-oxo-dGTP pyrophosphatase MutT (NUDIX family)